ncbi:MAG: exo-beta-N-acetylmuramidase NamZ domain-containing protein [Acidobacteriota bacterium]
MCENRAVKRSSIALVLTLGLSSFSFMVAGAQTAATRPPLIPQPREFTSRHDLSLSHGVRILVPGNDADDRFAGKTLAEALRQRGVKTAATDSAVRIWLLRDDTFAARRVLHREKMSFDPAMQPEGYALITGPHEVFVVGHTAAGVFYGTQTLVQLERRGGEGPIFAGAAIRDWPAMRWRGVQDDLSRGPVPTLAYQEQQIRMFAEYKLNLYSPYFENTMQYQSNPLPALPGGSISATDARALVEYAKPYHITIVPEQEAFGHLHKVLLWQQYAPLAEIPRGAVLAPGQPGSLRLITQWFDELAEIYPSPFLHIGADETFQLGQGQTAAEVREKGLGAVYVGLLSRIHQALEPLHRRLLFWGDIAMNSPDQIANLPHDMIAVAWHYEAEPQGFGKWLDPYTHAGMETWVAPGVNDWNRVWPNFDIALHNIQGFVADGQKAGSTGMLNTVWDDDGEGLFAEDWYAILYGAAASWQSGTSDIARFQQDFGPVFHGDESDAVNQAQTALMAAHQALASAGLDDARDAWFWADPWSTQGQKVDAKIRPVLADVRLDAERALTLLAQARSKGNLRNAAALDAMDLGARRIDFLALKFQLADQIADSYLRLYNGQKDHDIAMHTSRDLWDLAGVNGLCEDLRDGYNYLGVRYSEVWLAENRPFWLNNVTSRFDDAARLWVERGRRIAAARSQWQQSHTLPTPQEIGIEQEKAPAGGVSAAQPAVAPPHQDHVATGIDVLEQDHFAELAALAQKHGGHLRLGLMTNPTGVDAHGRRTIDVLQHDAEAAVPGLRLTTLFSPEHGINGSYDRPGVPNSVDQASGLPVVSLYGAKDADRRPSAEQLRKLDAVVIDLQDAGVRFYTYEAVVRYFLEAAAPIGTEIVVLDRPNPIGGQQVQGPVSDDGTESYVNSMPIPVRHGMTLGELARFDKNQLHLNVPLTVVAMQGWHRADWYDETGLPWVNPSPNLRDLEEATLYPALGLVEGTNISVGRGTETPFELFGAPWIDGQSLADALNQRGLRGVRFYPVEFTPEKPYPYAGEACRGVRILVTDRSGFNAPELGVEIASALHRLYSDHFQLQKMRTLLVNHSTLDAIAAGDDPQKIAQSWREQLSAFAQQRGAALIYPE